MPRHAGVVLILGADLMIPVSIRLDLFNATDKIPDEITIPLLRSAREVNDTTYGYEIAGRPVSSLNVESRLCEDYRLRRKLPSKLTHELWIGRLPTIVSTVI